MTNKEETDATKSQIVRASVLESHGWSSEQNRSQCKFRNKFSCFFCYLNFFLFVRVSCFLFYVTSAMAKRHSPMRLKLLLQLLEHIAILLPSSLNQLEHDQLKTTEM